MADEFDIPLTGKKVSPSRGFGKGIARPLILGFFSVLTLVFLVGGSLLALGRAQKTVDADAQQPGITISTRGGA